MKSRAEYEKLFEDTFVDVADAKVSRMQLDLLLDIRDLLIWFRDKEMLSDFIKARKEVEEKRKEENAVQKQSANEVDVSKQANHGKKVG